MTHQMKLNPNAFGKIKSGEKIIELRLFDEKRQKVSLGDNIEFTLTEDSETKILTEVVGLFRYKSFEDLYQDFPPEFTGSDTKDDWKLMRDFYSEENESKYGVIGIRIKVLS